MSRIIISKHISLLVVLAVVALASPLGRAEESGSSGGNSTPGIERQGRIESVTPTNFSIKFPGRHRRGLTGIVVHYNPETVQMTVDGVAVRTFDVQQTGKYAVVTGKIVNAVFEATSITVTTDAPARHSKRKSSQS